MQGVAYINQVINWLITAKGYQPLPYNSIAGYEALTGDYLYKFDGRALVVLKLVLAQGVSGEELQRNLDEEFHRLKLVRDRQGLQFAHEIVLHVFEDQADPLVLKTIQESKQVSALSRCYLLPWAVNLARNQLQVHQGMPLGSFGLLKDDSPLKNPALFCKGDSPGKEWGATNKEPLIRPVPQLATPWVTFSLIGLCVLLAAFTGFSTDPEVMVKFGAKVNSLVAAGEYWRLLTSVFLHYGLLHLGFNMLFLYSVGPAIEAVYGKWRFLTVYLAAGILGSIASFALSKGVSVGASGALFGLMGAYLYFWLLRPEMGRRVGREIIVLLTFNVVYGLLNPSVDNWAHLGGLVGGFLGSAAVGLPRDRQPVGYRVMALVGLAILAWLGLKFGLMQS